MLPVLRDGFDNVFGDMNSRIFDFLDQRFPVFLADVREDEENLYVEIDCPGFTKDEISVSMEKSILTIEAEQLSEAAGRRSRGRIFRSFRAPDGVEPNSVKASLTNGVLTVTIDRPEKSRARRIPVQGD